MAAVEKGRFYALLLLLSAAVCFAYVFGRECGVTAASKEFDRKLREVSRAVLEQNTRLNAAAASRENGCEVGAPGSARVDGSDLRPDRADTARLRPSRE